MNEYPYLTTEFNGRIFTIAVSSPMLHEHFRKRISSLGASERRVLRLIERDGECCHLCGEIVGAPPAVKGYPAKTLARWTHARPTVDHVIPRVRKPPPGLGLANLKLAHALCNSLRGHRPLEELPKLPDPLGIGGVQVSKTLWRAPYPDGHPLHVPKRPKVNAHDRGR